MQERYYKVITENQSGEVRKLLIEYHNALVAIRDTATSDINDDEIWMDKETTLSGYIDMHVQEMVN